MLTFFIALIEILVFVAVLYLILYLFSTYVKPIPEKIVGILTFIFFAMLVIWALTGHTLIRF